MLSKSFKIILMFMLVVGIAVFNGNSASAKVMWGKTELKLGQTGKVTILSDTNLYKLDSNGKLSLARVLKKGEEYRIYGYKDINGYNDSVYYNMGASNFIRSLDTSFKYQTPSKEKLAQLNGQSSATSQSSQTTSKPKDSDISREINFNMSVSQVEKSESAILLDKIDGGDLIQLKYETTKFGYNVHLSYFFQNGQLNYIAYDFLPGKDSYDIWDEMVGIHQNLHNKAVSEIGSDYTYTSKKYSALYTNWDRKDYDILLTVHDDRLFTTAQLVYYRK